jgi:hypothetical protein
MIFHILYFKRLLVVGQRKYNGIQTPRSSLHKCNKIKHNEIIVPVSRQVHVIPKLLRGMGRDSSVGIATSYGLDNWGSIPGMDKKLSPASQPPDRL